jgi:hypothetical protein
MASELKVYNRFGELTLHLRLSLDKRPELSTVDGTPEMRTAIASLRGSDFDRTVVKGNEHVRLMADWGSPEYLNVLGRYFVTNFGWSTKIVEAAQPSTSVCFAASGNYTPLVEYGIRSARPVDNAILVANFREDRPDFQPTATALPSSPAYGISAR